MIKRFGAALLGSLLLMTSTVLAGFDGVTTPGTFTYPDAGIEQTFEETYFSDYYSINGVFADEANDLLYTLYAEYTGGTDEWYYLYKTQLSDRTNILDVVEIPNTQYAWGSRITDDKSTIYIGDYCNYATSALTKVDLATMTVTQVQLAANPCITALTLDEPNNRGYFANGDSPTDTIFQFDLTTLAITGTLTLNAGEGFVENMMLSNDGSRLYAFSAVSPQQVVEIDTASMTRLRGAALPGVYDGLGYMIDDYEYNNHIYVYAFTVADDVELLKIDPVTLNVVATLPMEAKAYLGSSHLDYATGTLFSYDSVFYSGDRHTYLERVDLNTFTKVPVSDIIEESYSDARTLTYLPTAQEVLIFHDVLGDYSFLPTYQIYDANTLARKSEETLSLIYPENRSFVVDSDAGYGYFLSKTDYGAEAIIRFDLATGDLDRQFFLDDAYFTADDTELILDTASNKIFIPRSRSGTDDRIEILNLNTLQFDTPRTIINTNETLGAVDLDPFYSELWFASNNAGTNQLHSLDMVNDTFLPRRASFPGISYQNAAAVTHDSFPALYDDQRIYVFIENTGTGQYEALEYSMDPVYQGSVDTLPAGQQLSGASAKDTERRKVFLGLANSGDIRVFDLNTKQFTSTITLPGASSIRDIQLDIDARILYVTDNSDPSRVIKVDADTSEILGSYAFDEAGHFGVGIYPETNTMYGTKNRVPLKMVGTSLSLQGKILGTKMTLSSPANTVESVRYYSHAAQGNLRLALYDASMNKLWESGIIDNPADDRWEDVQISSGTPSTLTNLPAGDYWLAAQTDDPHHALGLTTGAPGSGFSLDQDFTSFPNTIAGQTSTTNNFSLALIYDTGITVTQSSGTTYVYEGGATDDISIVLKGAPSADVTITPATTNGLQVAPASITFTSGNWDIPQQFTLSIPDNGVPEPNRTSTISFTTTATSFDYSDISIPSITALIIDPTSLPPAETLVGISNTGTTNYPDAGIIRLDKGAFPDSYALDRTLTIDVANQKLYSTGLESSQIQKFDLSTFTWESAALTNRLEDTIYLDAGTVDLDTGIGYYWSNGVVPNQLYKVRMQDMEILERKDILGADNNNAFKIISEPNSDNLYIFLRNGLSSTPSKLAKFKKSTLELVDDLYFTEDESENYSLITPGDGFGYMGSDDTGRIYKINLSTMTIVDELPLYAADDKISVSLPKAYNGKIYFEVYSTTAPTELLVPVDLATFTLGAAIPITNYTYFSADIDATNGIAYLGSTGKLTRVDLNTGAVSEAAAPDPFYDLNNLAIDTTNGFAYSGANEILGRSAKLYKFDINAMTHVDTYTIEDDDFFSPVSVISGGSDYFYVESGSGRIAKINKNTTSLESTTYFVGDGYPFIGRQGVLDAARNAIYLGRDTVSINNWQALNNDATDDELIKINTNTMTVSDSINLGVYGEVTQGILDEPNNMGYFITFRDRSLVDNNGHSVIHKVNLNTFAVDTSLDLPDGYSQPGKPTIIGSMMYVPVRKMTAPVGNAMVAVDLATFTIDNIYSSTIDEIESTATDSTNGVIYLLSKYAPFQISAFDTLTGTISDSIALPGAVEEVGDIVYDQDRGFLFIQASEEFGSGNAWPVQDSFILKYDTAPLSYVGQFQGSFWLAGARGAFLDATREVIFGAFENWYEGSVARFLPSFKGATWGTKVTLTEASNLVDTVRFYAHDAAGNVRLALYDSSFQLVWESMDIPMTGTDMWYKVNISDGTPNTLAALPAGDYWFAFQTDSVVTQPGYAPGAANTGFFFTSSYGAFDGDASTKIAGLANRNFSIAMTVNVGVSLVESTGSTSVTEGAGSDSYTIVLASQPSADVNVQINAPAGVTTDVPSLVFTPNNWNIPQTVTVSAPTNGTPDGTRNLTISHVVITTDPYYLGQTIPDVTVVVTDIAPVAPTPTRSGGGGGGFSPAPNSFGEYMNQQNTNTNTATPPATDGGETTGEGGSTDGSGSSDGSGTSNPTSGDGTPTTSRPGPLMNGNEISLCEVQRLNLFGKPTVGNTTITLPMLEESNFRQLVQEYGLVLDNTAEAGNPFGHITRSEILRLVLQTQCGAFSLPKAKDAPFPDVTKLHKDALYVSVAKLQDIVTGYLSDGTFKPDNDISRAESLKIVLEVIFRERYPKIKGHDVTTIPDVAKDAWYYRYIDFATERAIIPNGTDFRPNDKATREDIASFLLQSLKVLTFEVQ